MPKEFKIAPKTLPIIANSGSTALPESILRLSASFLNHFFKAPLYFNGEEAGPPHRPKTLLIAST